MCSICSKSIFSDFIRLYIALKLLWYLESCFVFNMFKIHFLMFWFDPCICWIDSIKFSGVWLMKIDFESIQNYLISINLHLIRIEDCLIPINLHENPNFIFYTIDPIQNFKDSNQTLFSVLFWAQLTLISHTYSYSHTSLITESIFKYHSWVSKPLSTCSSD